MVIKKAKSKTAHSSWINSLNQWKYIVYLISGAGGVPHHQFSCKMKWSNIPFWIEKPMKEIARWKQHVDQMEIQAPIGRNGGKDKMGPTRGFFEHELILRQKLIYTH